MANTYLLSCLENDTKQNPSKALPNSRMAAWIRTHHTAVTLSNIHRCIARSTPPRYYQDSLFKCVCYLKGNREKYSQILAKMGYFPKPKNKKKNKHRTPKPTANKRKVHRSTKKIQVRPRAKAFTDLFPPPVTFKLENGLKKYLNKAIDPQMKSSNDFKVVCAAMHIVKDIEHEASGPTLTRELIRTMGQQLFGDDWAPLHPISKARSYGVVEPSTDGFRVSASFGKVWDNWVKWDKNKFYAKLTGTEENEDEEDEEEEEEGSDSMDETTNNLIINDSMNEISDSAQPVNRSNDSSNVSDDKKCISHGKVDYKFDELLKEWGLEKYTEAMKDEGWDDWRDWKDLTEEDLKDDMSFAKGHIRRFMRCYAEWMAKMDQEKII
eukprot:245517_1